MNSGNPDATTNESVDPASNPSYDSADEQNAAMRMRDVAKKDFDRIGSEKQPGEQSTDLDPTLANFKLEEYKAVRAEIIASIGVQQTSLRFGSAVVLAMIIFAMSNLNDVNEINRQTSFALLVLTVVVPATCYLTLAIWIGEVWRMMRAGEYIHLLEKDLNSHHFARTPVLRWEAWRRSTGNKNIHFFLRGNYWGVMVLFFGGALFSYGLGSTILFVFNDWYFAFFGFAANLMLMGLVIFWVKKSTKRFR